MTRSGNGFRSWATALLGVLAAMGVGGAIAVAITASGSIAQIREHQKGAENLAAVAHTSLGHRIDSHSGLAMHEGVRPLAIAVNRNAIMLEMLVKKEGMKVPDGGAK